MEHIFREYDIRGIFQKDLNETSVKAIGYKLGSEILKVGKSVAVGEDARTHSPTIANWLISGLNEAGVKVYYMGLVPTPCNYFAGFSEEHIDATIMITGSHNPKEYNGFKITIKKLPFFGKELKALGKKVEENRVKILSNPLFSNISTKESYIDFLVTHFKKLKGLKNSIAIDCGNGAAGEVVRAVVDKLELNATLLYEKPDGNFPNHHPDPSIEENLKDLKELLKTHEIGFAFDGDADRLAVLTSKYNIVADELVVIFAKTMENPQILGEVKCSSIMYDEVDKIGKSFMYKTGHSNIKMKMQELNIDIATEVSGHIFFADRYYGYDDAIYAMLRVLELIKDGVNLNKEYEKLPRTYKTAEIKVKTTEKKKFKIIDELKKTLQNPPKGFPTIKELITIDGVRVVFENGWGLIRASNTTPDLVTRFEANSKEDLRLYQKVLGEVLLQKL